MYLPTVRVGRSGALVDVCNYLEQRTEKDIVSGLEINWQFD